MKNEPVTNNTVEDGDCEDSTGTIAWSQVASNYKCSSKNLRNIDILQPSKPLPTTNRFSTLTLLPEPLTSSDKNSLAERRTIDPSNNNHKRKKEQRSARHIPKNHHVRSHGQPSKVYRAPGSEILGGNKSDLKPNLHSAKDYISYYRNDTDNSGTNVKMTHNGHGSTQLIPTMVNGEMRENNNSEIAYKHRQNGKCSAWINEMKAKLTEKRNRHTLNKKHKIVCIGDSHVRGSVDSAKNLFSNQFEIYSFFKPGSSSSELNVTANQEISKLGHDDVLIICGGTNDSAVNKSTSTFHNISNFVTRNNHTNVILVNVPYRYDTGNSSIINEGIERLNKTLNKLFTVSPRASFLKIDQNGNLFTNHGLHHNRLGKQIFFHQIAITVYSLFEQRNTCPYKFELA
jgi:hypothetical protein